MKALRLLFVALSFTAGHAQAQNATPAEISFWESVRNSKEPAELRAYLQQFPNGIFRPLAEARLAALEKGPAAPPSAPPTPSAPATPAAPVLAGQKHVPQAGDTWTYRLSFPRVRGEWGQAARPAQNLTVRANEVSEQRVVDAVSVDGGTPVAWTHSGRQLVAQGAAVFSPYLSAFDALPPGSRLGAVAVADACPNQYLCEAKARIVGSETVVVPAGRFAAIKVIVDHEWRTANLSGWQVMRMQGGRTLTVWYAPEIGRAVKYSSRLVAGDLPAVDSNFDLELVSYELKK